MSNILNDLKDRGLLNNVTNEEKFIDAINNNKAIYVGFDPSADSLHLGNYIMIMLLKRFKSYNIRTFALVGGATGMIGDPSGKSSERNLLDKTTLNHNIISITNQLKNLTNANVINNYEFYKDMNFLDFLRDVGKLININYLLEKEIISSRLETGISYTEFSYNLLQGYDFLKLYNEQGVSIQVGGSDQWGNITTGIEMIRKSNDINNNACGITINLLTNNEGKKFGKSEKGAIFLDEKKTSVYEMYQFLINQNDSDVNKLLNFLTMLSVKEIKNIMQEHSNNPALRIAQKTLASEVVRDIHGEEKLKQAIRISKALFEGEITNLNEEEFLIAIKSLPIVELEDQGIKLIDLLTKAEVAKSNRIARDFLKANSISINNQNLSDENLIISKNTHSIKNKYTIIKKGKRSYFLVIWK